MDTLYEYMTPRPSILILLLAITITASPLWGLIDLPGPEDGSGHTHHHSHDGHYHSHQHHHDGDEDDPSQGDDHHSDLDDTPGGALIVRTISRRLEAGVSVLPSAIAILTAPVSGDWQQYRCDKRPPYTRSSQTSQRRTIVLLV